ncbi:hypothetical protein HALLA_01570 (plasmid) [Halostagnicola larsenii XH-48]|uniref:PGF-CTERM sorting domain-containing protein n=1 Tax=Halostagnicola larsenii XH-48 TaxID=797299 RepID=W0JTT0_9EURY|nr:hypothetical protein [Halostagnicola larsenii]AHG02016.1 hypothetical protein HALLA_01570 [Halostagnicola larsenii XH-48]
MNGVLPVNFTRAVLTIALCAVLVTGVIPGAALSADGSLSADAAVVPPEANVSEPAYEEPAPEPGDQYFEAADPEDNWISYTNPRDNYRSPYLGDGSGKICVTLLNKAGEPVVGESVPDTTVTIPTGDTLTWHSYADPMTVEYPLTDNYEWPLDADQFGTSPDLPQGDGYMDSHCIEFHGHPEGATVEYGEVQIEGDHADDIEFVGYVEQPNSDWNTSVDPIADAESYEEVGGNWTYQSEEHERLHGQVVAVLQLDVAEGHVEANDDDDQATDSDTETNTEDENETEDVDETPGFGLAAAVIALSALALARYRR